jgi:hypothetical protein
MGVGWEVVGRACCIVSAMDVLAMCEGDGEGDCEGELGHRHNSWPSRAPLTHVW